MRIVIKLAIKFTLILGVQVASVYSYIEPTTRVAVKSHALPVYKKNRLASLPCIFETSIFIRIGLSFVLGSEIVCVSLLLSISTPDRRQSINVLNIQRTWINIARTYILMTICRQTVLIYVRR